MDEIPRTKTGLTLFEAEQRIDSLEIAAAKAVVLLAETLKNEQIVDKHGSALIACVELLFDELKLEGMKHSQFVEESLSRTATAEKELRQTLLEQRTKNK
jgi:hypothetical protein